MPDVVDKATRSRMMSGIRAKDTRPELFLRKGLHALGFRFRLHVKDIPGKPDIVLPKYRALIVIHGCFWHGHDCRYFKTPQTNRDFWINKIASNALRDKRNMELQLGLGWRVLVVWECAVRASMKESPVINCVPLAAQWITGRSRRAQVNESGILEL